MFYMPSLSDRQRLSRHMSLSVHCTVLMGVLLLNGSFEMVPFVNCMQVDEFSFKLAETLAKF